jgi:hypothetical protein
MKRWALPEAGTSFSIDFTSHPQQNATWRTFFVQRNLCWTSLLMRPPRLSPPMLIAGSVE